MSKTCGDPVPPDATSYVCAAISYQLVQLFSSVICCLRCVLLVLLELLITLPDIWSVAVGKHINVDETMAECGQKVPPVLYVFLMWSTSEPFEYV